MQRGLKTMSKKTKVVLVVDDEDTMREIIQLNLSRSPIPITVHNTSTGEEGVALYRMLCEKGEKPDLVIMDINLTQWGTGSIDGVEATRQIMAFDPDAVIYGYTAWFTHGVEKQLIDAGAKQVIERTVRPSEFRKIVEEYLSSGE